MVEKGNLPALPEAARVQGDHRAEHPAAPGQLQHQARAHGAAHGINAQQLVLGEKARHGVGQGGDRVFAGQLGGLAVAGQVHGQHVALGGQHVEQGVPGPPAAADAVH
nr:hypothetical protein [Hymenobacter crusticola]